MKMLIVGAAAAVSMAWALPAAATVVINVGGGALQPDENVLFNINPTPDFSLEGMTNQTGTLLTITGGETLAAAGGQARLDTADGTISSPFTFYGFNNQLVGFDLKNAGLAFTQTEFRLNVGTATSATLTFVDTMGEVFSQTFAIPRSGYFSAEAIDGQLIDYFSIATNGTLADIRQIRIGGVVAIPTTAVPEPATWAMMIMGFGAAGSLLRRRRAAIA